MPHSIPTPENIDAAFLSGVLQRAGFAGAKVLGVSAEVEFYRTPR